MQKQTSLFLPLFVFHLLFPSTAGIRSSDPIQSFIRSLPLLLLQRHVSFLKALSGYKAKIVALNTFQSIISTNSKSAYKR